MENNQKSPARKGKLDYCPCGRALPIDDKQDTCDVCLIADEVMEKFGEALVRHFPMATSGDLSPERTLALTQALEKAILEWIWNNVVDRSDDGGVV